MSSIVILLSPFWLSWKNDFLRGGRPPMAPPLAAGRVGDGFWCGIYYVVRRVLLYFNRSMIWDQVWLTNCC